MSKMVCEICGTTYDDAAGDCPVCGWKPGQTLDTAGDMDDILNDDFNLEDMDDIMNDVPPQKNKAVFDYDAVNPRRRPQAASQSQPQSPKAPRSTPRPAPAPVQPEEDEEEESGSNKFLVIVLVVLILALLAVSGYIAYTKLWKPNQVGSDDNKPQQTVATEPVDITQPTAYVPVNTEEVTEATEAGVPCTGISLVASIDTLEFAGQNWRLMVKTEPEDTTDKVTFTSGDEAVVTVDEYGRVTAVGEGETYILITCGEKRLETPAVVRFSNGSTEETAAAPAEGTSGTGTGNGTVATPSSGVLKLKKTDITFSVRGVYVTLELENGISPESVKWSTSDSSVATVYNGNVTALGKGVCVIRAEYEGQVAECVVRCNFK